VFSDVCFVPKADSCTATIERLINHLVSKRQQLIWDIQTEYLCGLSVDYKRKICRLYNREVRRFLALKNPPSINADWSICVYQADSVTYEAPGCDELGR